MYYHGHYSSYAHQHLSRIKYSLLTVHDNSAEANRFDKTTWSHCTPQVKSWASLMLLLSMRSNQEGEVSRSESPCCTHLKENTFTGQKCRQSCFHVERKCPLNFTVKLLHVQPLLTEISCTKVEWITPVVLGEWEVIQKDQQIDGHSGWFLLQLCIQPAQPSHYSLHRLQLWVQAPIGLKLIIWLNIHLSTLNPYSLFAITQTNSCVTIYSYGYSLLHTSILNNNAPDLPIF